MTKNNFFKIQSDLTAVKILFFEHYIENFLIKILMQFGSCIIGDLFCGLGKNGQKDGSPLILLKKAKKILQNEILLKKHPNPKIIIIFNDNNQDFINNLKKELNKIEIPHNIEISEPTSQDFSELLKYRKDNFKKNRQAKFFFLDPFGYSNIHIEDIKTIMLFPFTEILLFIPTSHIYRFSDSRAMEKKTRQFLEEFTIKGPGHYSSLGRFIESIQLKLLQYIGLDYVRPITIDGGQNKNTLFFLTKHIIGMININNIFWKFTKDGEVISVSESLGKQKDLKLFESEYYTTAYKKFLNELTQFIQEKGKLSNKEIIKFTARNGMRLKHANKALHQIKKQGKIEPVYFDESKKRGFYVSKDYWNKLFCEINYRLK